MRATSSAKTDGLKSELFKKAAPTERGTRASLDLQQDILDTIKNLESENSAKSPAQSPDINGWWSLIYQSTPEPSSKWDPNTEVEGPFLAAFKPLTKNLITGKGNFQQIDTLNGKVQNLATFRIGNRQGYLNILGTCAPNAGEPENKVDVTFEDVDIKVEGLGKLRLSLSWVRPHGWVKTTYLDPEFRIGRGDKGSVFVAARTKGEPSVLSMS
eukprot:CAMPEP_0170174594 /NCGR_PEP_ID=MMETSP0040_2-20121228/7812_1 /TAXON_ID=641309 /ORGANISM="Lotharella oceanica, Strain CCMP622" /LENGTH=212 /DNA_ID=CAMNT_0010416295 /DNA_START=126 /DNA_END=764 /DNA_ORIENTATION=-